MPGWAPVQLSEELSNRAILFAGSDRATIEPRSGTGANVGGLIVRLGGLAAVAAVLMASLPACQTTQTAQGPSYHALKMPGSAYPITSPFGTWVNMPGCSNKRRKKSHSGIDIPAPRGTPVYSPVYGKVTASDFSIKDAFGKRTYGGNVVHVEPSYTEAIKIVEFAHLDRRFVEVGDYVNPGEAIGTVGGSGLKGCPVHLHFSVFTGWDGENGRFIKSDPVPLLTGPDGGILCVDPNKEYTRARVYYAAENGEPALLYPVACTR